MEREETTGIVGLVVAIPIIALISISVYWAIGALIPLAQGHFWIDVLEGIITVFITLLLIFAYSWLKFLYPHSWTEAVITKILRSLE